MIFSRLRDAVEEWKKKRQFKKEWKEDKRIRQAEKARIRKGMDDTIKFQTEIAKLRATKPRLTPEEYQKKIEKYWEEYGDPAVQEENEYKKSYLQFLRECNVDESDIKLIMNRYVDEGKNVDEDGNEFWLCEHCGGNLRFKTREEYMQHHYRVHG